MKDANTLYVDIRYTVLRDAAGFILRVTRSSEPFRSVYEMSVSCDQVQAALDSAGRGRHVLLVDSRLAPFQNDAGFEEAFKPQALRMTEGFRRVAIVMKFASGVMHSERLLRSNGNPRPHVRVFVDEAFALDYLRGRT